MNSSCVFHIKVARSGNLRSEDLVNFITTLHYWEVTYTKLNKIFGRNQCLLRIFRHTYPVLIKKATYKKYRSVF